MIIINPFNCLPEFNSGILEITLVMSLCLIIGIFLVLNKSKGKFFEHILSIQLAISIANSNFYHTYIRHMHSALGQPLVAISLDVNPHIQTDSLPNNHLIRVYGKSTYIENSSNVRFDWTDYLNKANTLIF